MGNSSSADVPHSAFPSTSVNPANMEKAGALIRTDRQVTIDELASDSITAYNNTESLQSLNFIVSLGSSNHQISQWIKLFFMVLLDMVLLLDLPVYIKIILDA